MTSLLIVRAHPLNEESSRSMQVTDAFLKSYKQHHPQDKINDINLYEQAIPEIDRHLLNAWEELRAGKPFDELTEIQQEKATLFNGYTESFLSADKVIVANPLWNLNVPARLKAWIDTITVSGVTFKYNEAGKAVGTVRNKKALHIQANGGTYTGSDPASQYLKTIFGFIGVTDFQELFVEGMDHNPDQAQLIVAEARDKAIELAKTF